jgi:predicted nucleic acid-binding protein
MSLHLRASARKTSPACRGRDIVRQGRTREAVRGRRHHGSILCAPASVRWEVGNAATAGVKRRRLTPERARQLVTDFQQVTIRELSIDLERAVDLSLELGVYAYDAYILEAARSSGYALLALDGPIQRNAKKMGLPLVELDL